MNKRKFFGMAGKILTVLLLAAVCVLLFKFYHSGGTSLRPEGTRQTAEYEKMTRDMNIRNMVSAIYLGPRIIDTSVEVLIVVLTVFGMGHIRGKK